MHKQNCRGKHALPISNLISHKIFLGGHFPSLLWSTYKKV